MVFDDAPDMPEISPEETRRILRELPEWECIENHLTRTYRFPDFRSALEFTNKIGELAEAEGHHPDLHLSWGKVRLEIWTHSANSLTEKDFILAAKVPRALAHG